MAWTKVAMILCVILLVASAGLAYDQNNPPPPAQNQDTVGAMFLSIAHPGLGEWCNAGWGGWDKVNKKKFWYGFIPFYGWPGYLQVRSAIDAKRGKTW